MVPTLTVRTPKLLDLVSPPALTDESIERIEVVSIAALVETGVPRHGSVLRLGTVPLTSRLSGSFGPRAGPSDAAEQPEISTRP